MVYELGIIYELRDYKCDSESSKKFIKNRFSKNRKILNSSKCFGCMPEFFSKNIASILVGHFFMNGTSTIRMFRFGINPYAVLNG